LVGFQLEKNLLRRGAGYMVMFTGSETKNGSPLEFPLAEILIEPMRKYLEIWRPTLISRKTMNSRVVSNFVWVSSEGAPLHDQSIYTCIKVRTRKAFGKHVNPHSFRNAAATTLVVYDPAHIGVAAPLLGHRSFETTERHYIEARVLEGHRSYLDVLQDLKKEKTRG
jgi:site-specific recombinase XerD